MNAAEVTAFLDPEFPRLLSGHGSFVIESVAPMTARVRLIYAERHLRPGGTLSGPSMLGLCDVSLYIAILAQIGPVALAVTTNLNINFLRRPQARDLLGECQLIKLGKRLAVGEVWVYPQGSEGPVAHADRDLFDPAPVRG
jgi:uncharacterized protein (TIGR00369 family)